MTSKTETKTTVKRGARAEAAPYHHGALHEALLAAAERILERDGLVGLTLRAAAREAGVSHAAPTHHFGDLTGLLSELAAVGFRRFREALLAAADAETGTGARLDAMGGAYVAFAKRYPGMFTLMFRSERLDLDRPVLAEAMDAAGAALAQAVGARWQETIVRGEPSVAQAADIVRAWAMVHGYAVLLLDGRLRHMLEQLPPGEDDITLLRAVLHISPELLARNKA
ncbi:TetR/AcrR family transcriptional regulator [Bradyrhizobium sp. 2TAF24]|uniref:TetR/AcrR family transcriptional regulator n=1 Tax=Bradyrhizobium sp. 2TAF24 TaxID=3233011 RepID=UPI003F916770